MSSHKVQTFEKMVNRLLHLFWGVGTLLVSSVTHRMKVSEIPAMLHHHIAVIRRCLLCGLSGVGFRKDVARTNVCTIPGTYVSSLLL